MTTSTVSTFSSIIIDFSFSLWNKMKLTYQTVCCFWGCWLPILGKSDWRRPPQHICRCFLVGYTSEISCCLTSSDFLLLLHCPRSRAAGWSFWLWTGLKIQTSGLIHLWPPSTYVKWTEGSSQECSLRIPIHQARIQRFRFCFRPWTSVIWVGFWRLFHSFRRVHTLIDAEYSQSHGKAVVLWNLDRSRQ